MQHDERDRSDSPDADDALTSSTDPIDPTHSTDLDAQEPPEQAEPDTIASSPSGPFVVEPASVDAGTSAFEPPDVESAASSPEASDAAATGEIESWPSQEATSPSPDAAGQRAWPTEAPAAGSGDTDAWPTEAPERGDEPVLEPEPAVASEPADAWSASAPPPEVEAYPAAPATDRDAASAPDSAMPITAAHAVPAGAGVTGESTQCPRCGTENRPGLAFCRNCGQRLVAAGVASTVERPGTPEGTTACPRCGTHNRAGVAFCQNCGANLRPPAPGYVPPAVAAEPGAGPSIVERRGAILGPVVLLIGLIGLVTAYLLPFAYGASDSLLERAMNAGGYGLAFWSGYPEVAAGLADQAYFGLAAPVPLLALLLLVLAVAGFARAAPGRIQMIGLLIALLWSVGLITLFVVVELAGNWSGDLVGMLRVLTPAGIIFLLASLIVVIGSLTRFGRS